MLYVLDELKMDVEFCTEFGLKLESIMRNSSLMSQCKLIRASLCSLGASVNIYLEPPALSRGYLTPYWLLLKHILSTAAQRL